MVGHKIILEGVDGAGKSTIANRIMNDNPELNYKIVHCTRHTPNTKEWFRELILSEDNIIFDRAMYGQFVYQTKEERKERGQLTVEDLYYLEEFMRDYGVEVWYVHADLNTCLVNCKKDSEDSYYTLDYIKSLDSKFRNLFDSISTMNVKYVFNDYVSDGSEERTSMIKKFDYSSLPEVYAVDFDGCLATDCFPDINKAIPNKKFINYLKEEQKRGVKVILWTCRTDGSLVDACNFLADQDFYPDAVNENIKEVKDSLDGGPIKVWASKYFDDKAVNVVFNG